MKIILLLCCLVLGALAAPMLDEKLGNAWTLFKRRHQKQYHSVEHETHR